MDRREEIFEKSMELFISEGYDNTPVSQIAKALNLTKAGLYHYFRSKEELLFFNHMHHLEKKLLPVLDEADTIKDPVARITFFVRSYIVQALTQDAANRVLIHEVNKLSPEHREQIKQIWARALKLLQDAISELKVAGKTKNFNITFAAFAALGMCSWTPYWFDYDRRESANELAETYVTLFLKGLLVN
jgi:TetR/AcrR family transcriptional regulator, cholesterol catabolism regulator